jgi:hypothetical protein
MKTISRTVGRKRPFQNVPHVPHVEKMLVIDGDAKEKHKI